MELTQHGLLEELLAPRRETWTSTSPPDPHGANEDCFSNGWIFESLDDSQVFSSPNPPFLGPDYSLVEPTCFPCPLNGLYHPFVVDGFSVPEIDSIQGEHPPMVLEDGEYGFVGINNDHLHCLEGRMSNSCKVEIQPTANIPVLLNEGLELFGDQKTSKVKKVQGQPSKNLMAERRRRKRLNDRLLMLRSIVPKITKMDRTAILGDTIRYMKELLEKVKKLREENPEANMGRVDLMGKEIKPNEILVRNSPKFDVVRTNKDTHIEIRCATRPGLLLSTIHTLEALDLDIQQCVVSCFNDFSMQGSCSEVVEQRSLMNTENIKQALYINAGYGGGCLREE